MIRKHILFSFFGCALILPLQSEAKDNLFNFSKSSSKANASSTKDIKTPNLCPQHYPLGSPIVISDEKVKIARRSFFLCEQNYAIQYDPATKNPIWVSERLLGSEQANTFVERVDNFQSHPLIPKPAQASLSDYRGSKFDRGHMAPAADMVDDYSMNQSFFLTNMVPQVGPNMNRGIWADLEAMARKWSEARGEVLVVSGPIFGQGFKTMGKSNVAVPTHLYKIVLDPKTNDSIAFIMPNVQIITRKTKNLDQGNPKFPQTMPQSAVNCSRACIIDDFIVPLTSVEQATGLQFFPNMNNQQKQLASQKGRMWSVRR